MEAAIWNTDIRGRPVSCAMSQGMGTNGFFLFDAEATLAVSHAIAELALEEASGRLLAMFQEFKNFEPHRERYWQLAATLDQVQVIGHGKKPAVHGRLKFIAVGQREAAGFWAVLYQGRSVQVLFIARQANDAKLFEERRFSGFYTFRPWIIERVREDIVALCSGRRETITEFERMATIDQAAKHLVRGFRREHECVDAAIRQLQAGGREYCPENFAVELDRSLRRLQKMRDALPLWFGTTFSNQRL